MLRFLLLRPIAVIMMLIASIAVSVLSFFSIPVSLLPDIDIPEITISVHYPNASPEEIDQNVLKPIREHMLTMNGIKSLKSIAMQERGTILLHMHYGEDMALAYIEANEKIDRLTSVLPPKLARPLVIKTNASDIPVVRIQVIPRRQEDQLTASELAQNVLKRRLEQIAGVGLVDINGVVKKVIRVTPNYEAMANLHLTDDDIIQTISDANIELGALSVYDGNYLYFLKLSSRISDPEALANLPVKVPSTNTIVRLSQVARVNAEPEKPSGFHLFDSQQGLVIAVHKQANARMPEVMPEVFSVVDQFRSDYPAIDFQVTQDQSTLLTLSIQNLSQSLIWGGLFAFAVLFLFMGGWREPVVMGIILPVSLLLCFSLLYLFNISLNIISLSGLALGLGMLVDNSIVVIDNIIIKRQQGLSLLDSCVQGTQEVTTPLASSALTNLAVFIPLIFMSGITGALFYDQAMAVVCILSVSILCTFILVPLLYLLLNRNREVVAMQDSRVIEWLKNRYHRSLATVWKHKALTFGVMCAFIPVSILLLIYLPKEGFPEIERRDMMVFIDWNEPITVDESRDRVRQLLPKIEGVTSWEADIGHHQFVLRTASNTTQHVEAYLLFESETYRRNSSSTLLRNFTQQYPRSGISLVNAPNPFEQLFISKEPEYEVRLRDAHSKQSIPIETATDIISKGSMKAGEGFETESMASIRMDFEKMRLYEVPFPALIQKLKIIFGEHQITAFKNFGGVIPVLLTTPPDDSERKLQTSEVKSENGRSYPLKEFITVQYELSYKMITADASGTFQSLVADSVNDEPALRKGISDLIHDHNLDASFSGTWFEDRDNLRQLGFILVVSFILMYFIITAEFESFTQPLIVIATIPIGLCGSLVLLWLGGGSINIMSGIGLVVVLGILDNDAILKIDRINTLRKTMPLESAIHQAGLDRFKPIVMNTCTNALALTPIVFSSGLGADLQRPVAITTIGGLIVATIAALYFIPLLYWMIQRKPERTQTMI